jgi:hypothetical protein
MRRALQVRFRTPDAQLHHNAEAEIVAALDQQLAEKREDHALQWRRLVESDEVSESNDDKGDAMVLDSAAPDEDAMVIDSRGNENEGSNDGEGGSWATDSEVTDCEEAGDNEEFVDEPIDTETALAEFREIKEVAGKE